MNSIKVNFEYIINIFLTTTRNTYDEKERYKEHFLIEKS